MQASGVCLCVQESLPDQDAARAAGALLHLTGFSAQLAIRFWMLVMQVLSVCLCVQDLLPNQEAACAAGAFMPLPNTAAKTSL